ncbi:MAG: TonB-dependent receptor [Flavobacteriaceae bacterium]|nr:TonB-dependent receptor [Flavobacteriaceae bacterium]
MKNLLSFFILIPMIMNSQTVEIYGSINSEDEKLSYASLSILDYNIGTIADENGNFKLKVNLSKHKILFISFIGYISKKIYLDDPKIDLQNLKVVLVEDINGLNEVVITGTLKDEYITESPVKVNVITSKKINSFLPSAGANITKIVQLVSGVKEVISCGVCYTNSISINGLEGPYTSILLDGIPMYGNLASVYGLNGIPNMIVDRLEIVKGPSSTLYGSEAVAGVINIITKNPKEQPLLSLDIQAVSHKESFTNLSFTPEIGRSFGYFGINWDRKNNYDDYNNDGFGDDINLDRFSVFNKWNIYRDSAKEFIISARYYFEDRRNGIKDYLKNNNYKKIRGDDKIYGESIYTNRFEIFGKYEFAFTDGFELNYSYSKHDQNSYYGSDYYEAKQNIFFSQFTLDRNYGKHDLLLGLSIKNNLYDDNTIATESEINGVIIDQESNQFIPGLLIQDQYKPSKKISLIGGLRIENYNEHGFIYAPSFHIKYNPGQWLSMRLNAGTGFRIVNLFTEDHAFISGQREVKILEDLKPERSKSIIFNTNYIYTGLSGSGNIDLDFFYTHFSNKIIPNYYNQNFIIYENSDGYAYSKGISGALNHTFLNGIAFSLSFNHQIVRYIKYNNNIKSLNYMEHSPKWSSGLNLKFPINKRWSLNSSSNYTGIMQLPTVYEINNIGLISSKPRETKSKPFIIHNININGLLKNKNEIYFGILNVFNFRQKESPLVGYNDPNFDKGFSPFFDTSYSYAPNNGRKIFIGYRLMIGKKN